jgi:hypothetical protein
MVWLILKNMNLFKAAETPREIRKRKASLWSACEAACREDYLEAFLAVAKRVHAPEDAFVRAGHVDGAPPLIECLTGSVDVESEHERHGWPQSLRAYVLHHAISSLQVGNVEYLLARGF